MRKIKVGLSPTGGCANVYSTAKTTYEGEITELLFSDGHKIKAITKESRKPDCSGCYIREYSSRLGMQPVCPRDPDGGFLICVPREHTLQFICLENLMEDI